MRDYDFNAYFVDLVKESLIKLGECDTAMTFNVPPATLEALFEENITFSGNSATISGGKMDAPEVAESENKQNKRDPFCSDYHIFPFLSQKTRELLQSTVAQFPYGALSVSHTGETVVFTADREAVRAISALPRTSRDDFLASLVQICARGTAEKAEIYALFRKNEPDFHMVAGDGEDFDEALYFDAFDPFVYCFHFDFGGAHYHRLLRSDFTALYGTRLP